MRMTKFFLSLTIVAILAAVSSAQHSDIEYGLDDLANPTSIVFGGDAETTADGIRLYEAEFNEPFAGVFTTDDPGFEADLNPNDIARIRIVDATAAGGEGFLNFYDPTNGTITAGGLLEVRNLISLITEAPLVLDGATASGDNPQTVSVADSDDGEAHGHVDFDIDDAATPGAYGLLAQLEVTAADGNYFLESEQFFIVFNHQLSDDVFENEAVPAFLGLSAVPEPTSAMLLSGVLGSLFLRRRRRQ